MSSPHTDTPRLRVFAGPNGSGKSTLVRSILRPDLLGVYLNADDMESEIRTAGSLDLSRCGVEVSGEEIRDCFSSSSFLKSAGFSSAPAIPTLSDGVLDLRGLEVTSYHASVLAGWLREKLMGSRRSFTFETVMSHPDKVALLEKAQGWATARISTLWRRKIPQSTFHGFETGCVWVDIPCRRTRL